MLALEAIRKHFLDTDENIYGTMSQSRKKRSTANRAFTTGKQPNPEKPKKLTQLTSLLETLAH